MNRRFRIWFTITVTVLTLLIGWGFTEIFITQEHQEGIQGGLHSLVIREGQDRETAVLKNVSARKQDCEQNDKIINALRENIQQGKREIPLLLKLLPQLNTKEIIAKINKEDARELKAFALVNCTKYALEAVPNYEKHKLTLEEQQFELKHTQESLRRFVVESAEERVSTVSQRCVLTGEIVTVLNHFEPKSDSSFRTSYRKCEQQLKSVKKLAKEVAASP